MSLAGELATLNVDTHRFIPLNSQNQGQAVALLAHCMCQEKRRNYGQEANKVNGSWFSRSGAGAYPVGRLGPSRTGGRLNSLRSGLQPDEDIRGWSSGGVQLRRRDRDSPGGMRGAGGALQQHQRPSLGGIHEMAGHQYALQLGGSSLAKTAMSAALACTPIICPAPSRWNWATWRN